MYKKWLEFYNNHPFWSIIIVAIVGSFIGITIEYVINRDFIGSGIYVVLFYTIIQICIVLKKKKK